MRDFLDLGSFALADKSSRVGGLEPLRDGIGDFGAGGLGKGLELGERFLGGNFVARAEFDPDQDRAFDVFERLAIGAAQMKTSCQPVCWHRQSIKNSYLSRRRRNAMAAWQKIAK